mgnify:CR=1 FL=1
MNKLVYALLGLIAGIVIGFTFASSKCASQVAPLPDPVFHSSDNDLAAPFGGQTSRGGYTGPLPEPIRGTGGASFAGQTNLGTIPPL